ncbi:glycosyltransferase family 4 protein [Patescibacteria group bacterium]|nr:glycosyltransferase family 4 protein [Patescibacteria group bacterium]
MQVLMISLDKGLLGKGQLGDVVSRHQEYGQHVEKLDIIVFSKKGYEKYQLSENVHSIPTNSKTKLCYFCNSYKIGKGLFKNSKYDLIVCQTPFIAGLVGYRLAKKFKAKLLVHFHGDFVDNKEWLKEKWYNIFLLSIAKFVFRRSDGIRVMSKGIKDKLVSNGIKAEKIKVISTPVNLSKFENPDEQKVTSIKSKYQNKKILLFVGRLEQVKDFPTLLTAAEIVKKDYKDFVVLVLGNGSKYNEWKSLAEKSEVRVDFLNQLDHKELVNYYQACDFIVNSSTNESFGKIFVEAAAASKTSVATNTTGAQEIIIDGQTGLLSPVNDPSSLAANIIKLLKNQDLTSELGQKAKELVNKKYDGANNTREIINFWQEIIR